MALRPLIGKMRTIGVLHGNRPTKLGAGYRDNYNNQGIATVGEFKRKSGSRRLDSGELVLYEQCEFICRATTELKDAIKVNSQFFINDQWFAIDSYTYLEQKHFYFRFILNAEENGL